MKSNVFFSLIVAKQFQLETGHNSCNMTRDDENEQTCDLVFYATRHITDFVKVRFLLLRT